MISRELAIELHKRLNNAGTLTGLGDVKTAVYELIEVMSRLVDAATEHPR